MPCFDSRVFRFSCVAATLALTLALGGATGENTSPEPGKNAPFFLQGDPENAPQRINEALDVWEPDIARNELEALGPGEIDPSLSIYLDARISFLEGDYERASQLLADLQREGSIPKDVLEHFKRFVDDTHKQTKDYVSKESAHFKIFYPAGPEEVLLDDAFETLEAQYDGLAKAFGVEPQGKIRVEFAPSGKAFLTLSDIEKTAVETTGTIALCKYNRLIVTSPRAMVRGYDWRDTIAHELVHYFIYKRTKNRTPVWLHEGIARYFENLWGGGALGVLDPSQETLLLRALEKDKIIPLKRMHPSFVYLDSAADGAQAFAQVDTIVEYIHKKVGGGTYDVLNKILDELESGKEYEPAIAAAVGEPFEKFYAGWLAYLKTRPLRVLSHAHVEEVRFSESEEDLEKDEIEKIDSEKVRQFVRVGDLLKNRGRFAGAAEEYEKANKEFGVNPIILNKLAFVLVQSGQPDAALGHLKVAEENFPSYGSIYKRFGEVYSLKQDWSQAAQYFQRALDINPFDVEVLRMITGVFAQMKDEAGAERYAKALKLLGY